MTERKQGKRSAQDAEHTKCEIMRVATELFCELGYERVSLRNISDKAGVSHSLIRHHFGSKEQIWYAISDGLAHYIEKYMRTILNNIPQGAEPNVQLYLFAVRLLANMLVFKQPIQLIADAVRQEEALFDYFIDSSGELEALVLGLEADYNNANPDKPIRIKEVKWQLMMFAHSAASLSPFMRETWSDETSDPDLCLLKHWQMANQLMAGKFNIPESQRLTPNSVSELVYDVKCDQLEHLHD